MELPDTEPSLDSTAEDDTYSGTATFLYTSKITGNVNLEGVCEILAESNAFSFALTSRGKIYFTEDNRLRSQQLRIEPTITEQGMIVSGHNDFLKANPGDSNSYALSLAFDLLLSDIRLFNSAYGFPTESARIFMRPIAIRCEDDETHELVIPYIRVYKGGIISISLPIIAGFEGAATQKLVRSEVNKSRRNLTSVLCERELHIACTECQIAQMSRRARIVLNRPGFSRHLASSLRNAFQTLPVTADC
ncbi:hypothetical protein [Pseudomonas chlororaphis]|uniref:hypothetical protein n=1 Tax=Pseudomonas chlororaphis TaxID=587753 RepID=UPI0015DE8844|nr:hypothetical protein [Pseudomonas chlororaphis]QLL12282.1 hypothetical protein H0I86_25260 [Pseudomonas chlororaphis subsp. aurantiaca]